MPASDVYSWAKASTKPSYSWNEITGKPSTFTPSSHSHSLITRADHLDTVAKVNAFIEANTFKYGTIAALDGLDGLAKNDGLILSASWKDSTNYGHQIYLDDNGYTIAHRYINSGTWSAWKTLIDTSNYTSYTVTKTGSGASGTWGINVTGSAGSVAWGNVSGRPSSLPASDVYAWAKASSKPSYGWVEITGKPSSFTPSSHTHNYLPLNGGTVTGATAFNSGVTIKNAGLELYHSSTPFIDFHYANSTADYTSRIIENAKGVLNINGTCCTAGGSLWCTSFSTDGGGTFGGDLSATRGLKLNHSGTSLYLYNDGGSLCMMHTGKDGNSTWPIIWNFAGDNLQTGNNFRVFKEGNGEAQIHANNSLRDVYLCASSSGRAGIYDTQAGWIVRSEADHTTSYIGECMVKWGKVTAKADSTSWLNGAQPGYAAFEAINTTAGALVPGMRIRTADGAWVLASYATDPGFRIYYANASRLNNNNQNSYDQIFTFGSSGTFYTKSVSQTSDERRKNIITNLATLPQAHKDFFMKLNPFTFKWKDNNEDLLSHYGVGAQSVYQAALDCGFTDDDLGFIHKGKEYPGTSIPWSVSYTEFIPLNIGVTQDHETRIEKLERENEELKQQIKELKGLTA